MPISYPIHAADTDALKLEPKLVIELAHPAIGRSVIRSEEQVIEYGRVFRETLDLIRNKMPACRRVHLFYAGPMALAFHIGQQISENIHPPVVVWNFSRAYEWGYRPRGGRDGRAVRRPARQGHRTRRRGHMTIKGRFDRFTTNIRPTDDHIEEANRQTDWMVDRLHDKVADDGSFTLEKVLQAGSNAKFTSLRTHRRERLRRRPRGLLLRRGGDEGTAEHPAGLHQEAS